MKKISILSGILFFFTVANGQINKGAILIGGQLSSSDVKTNSNSSMSSSSTTSISVSLGKSFTENSLCGITLGYSPTSNSGNGNNNGISTEKSKDYSASVFYRKYKKLLTGLYLFNEVGARFDYWRLNYSSTDTTYKISSVYNNYNGSLYYTPGLAYRVCKKIDLELLLPSLVSLSYSTGKTNGNELGAANIVKNNSFAFNTSLSFSSLAFGVKFIL